MSIQKVVEEGIEYSDLDDQDKKTLRYLESCMVDSKGEIDPQKMNFHDFKSIDLFTMAGIIEIQDDRGNTGYIEITKFTDKAWELALESRKEKAESWIEHDIEGFNSGDDSEK